MSAPSAKIVYINPMPEHVPINPDWSAKLDRMVAENKPFPVVICGLQNILLWSFIGWGGLWLLMNLLLRALP